MYAKSSTGGYRSHRHLSCPALVPLVFSAFLLVFLGGACSEEEPHEIQQKKVVGTIKKTLPEKPQDSMAKNETSVEPGKEEPAIAERVIPEKEKPSYTATS